MCGSKKSDLLDWLEKNGIRTFSEDMKKAEFLEIVKQNKSRFITYKIDKIFEQYRHKALHFLLYHCHFNLNLICDRVGMIPG